MDLHKIVADEMEKMSILAGASTKSSIREIAVGDLVEIGRTMQEIPSHIVQRTIKDAAARVVALCGPEA